MSIHLTKEWYIRFSKITMGQQGNRKEGRTPCGAVNVREMLLIRCVASLQKENTELRYSDAGLPVYVSIKESPYQYGNLSMLFDSPSKQKSSPSKHETRHIEAPVPSKFCFVPYRCSHAKMMHTLCKPDTVIFLGDNFPGLRSSSLSMKSGVELNGFLTLPLPRVTEARFSLCLWNNRP